MKRKFKKVHKYPFETLILLWIPLYDRNITSPYNNEGLELEGIFVPVFYDNTKAMNSKYNDHSPCFQKGIVFTGESFINKSNR